MKLRMMNKNRVFYVAAAANTMTGKAELNKKIKDFIAQGVQCLSVTNFTTDIKEPWC